MADSVRCHVRFDMVISHFKERNVYRFPEQLPGLFEFASVSGKLPELLVTSIFAWDKASDLVFVHVQTTGSV
jgi:hypothetical protein